MKITGKKSLSSLIEICLKIIMIIGIIIVLGLPFFLQKYAEWMHPQIEYYPSLAILYASGIPALIIVYRFIKIFHTLKEDNPFNMENVKNLKVISNCSLLIMLEYMVGIFFITSVFAIVIIGVFAVVWLGCYILAELLKKAIDYKEENELTI
jgi:hypothetical protein